MSAYPSVDVLRANPILAIITGHTCGEACWHAREEVCRCSCGGANHGILNTCDGTRPQRTAKIGGQFYELVAVCNARESYAEEKRIMAVRFPNLDCWAYGDFREEKYMPVLVRKISESQSKWPEVKAIENCRYLVWSRPTGTRYLVRGPNHKAVYNDCLLPA